MYTQDVKENMEDAVFLGWGKSGLINRQTLQWENYGRYARRRYVRPLLAAFCLFAVAIHWSVSSPATRPRSSFVAIPEPIDTATTDAEDANAAVHNASETKLHFLISAHDADLDLCRTLLTSAILTYPSPTILGIDEPNQRNISRFPRISRVLDYVTSLDADHDEDLVLIVDGHETQFQLPVDVMLNRYHSLTRAVTDALRSASTGAGASNISQRVMFGADKRCASGATNDRACEATPPSPAASDLYGNYTDSTPGYNDWFHYRAKYVDDGFILGPLGLIREVFTRAEQIAKETQKSPGLESTSEQAVFARIFSEQERWRQSALSIGKPGSTWWLETESDETTTPRGEAKAKKAARALNASENYEFGMFVDYFSLLSHSTMYSDVGRDSQFLTWSDEDSTTFHEQANDKHQRDGKLDCVVNVPPSPPADLLAMGPPFYLLKFHDYRKGTTYEHAAESSDVLHGPEWTDIPLYTHLCFGNVPVMIHHSGDKQARNESWEHSWMRNRSNALLQSQRDTMAKEGSGAVKFAKWADFKQNPGIKVPGGAWGNDGQWTDWWDICPYGLYGQELFYRPP